MKNDIFFNKIEAIKQDYKDVTVRKLTNMDVDIYVLFVSQITDRDKVSRDIIKPILEYKKDESIAIDLITRTIIYIDDIFTDNDEEKILDYILKGNSVIIIPNEKKYIITNTAKIAKRAIEAPTLETDLRGPRDCFTENFDTNLSLIRYRIKDKALKFDIYEVGRRTKTKVAVVYIRDIANSQYVDEIKGRIEAIEIDGVLESGYIQKFILNNAFNMFPQVGIVERSDTACADILDGKTCIIVEGSNLGLTAPKTFLEFSDAGDDHYDNLYIGIFSKLIRAISVFVPLTLSSLYVAIVSFHSDILPVQYTLVLAQSRAGVPFNSLIEAGLMEVVAEILREASIRLPRQIGQAIGIVGTIVIGQAAVQAGLVSSLMVIIVSLSTMCSLVFPDYTIMNSIRILKFFLLVITAVFGLFGFCVGLTAILINLLSVESFGVSYLSPLAPFNLVDLKNYILSDITLSKKRPKFLKTKDKTRQ